MCVDSNITGDIVDLGCPPPWCLCPSGAGFRVFGHVTLTSVTLTLNSVTHMHTLCVQVSSGAWPVLRTGSPLATTMAPLTHWMCAQGSSCRYGNLLTQQLCRSVLRSTVNDTLRLNLRSGSINFRRSRFALVSMR